jgi:uncharacterized protein YlaI
MSEKPSTPDATPDKSTLFCPVCERQNRVDEGWRRVKTNSKTHYYCPDCNTELTTRPRTDPVSPFHEPGTFWYTFCEGWYNQISNWQHRVLSFDTERARAPVSRDRRIK